MRSKRGNVLAIAGAALPLFIGAAGLATDTIQWTLWKRQLQRAADSAAIAGVYDRGCNGGLTTGATTRTATTLAIAHDLTINLHTCIAEERLSDGHLSGETSCQERPGHGDRRDPAAAAVQLDCSSRPRRRSRPPPRRRAFRRGRHPASKRLDTPRQLPIISAATRQCTCADCDVFSNSATRQCGGRQGKFRGDREHRRRRRGNRQLEQLHVDRYRPYSPPLADPFAGVTARSERHELHRRSALTANSTVRELRWQRARTTNCFSLAVKRFEQIG